jgi:pimeloyl-ACP methyl ester carboxylesterase
MPRRLRPRIAVLLSLALLAPGARAGAPPAVQPVEWRACATDLVHEHWVAHWGNRLECGTLLAPLDHARPGRASFNLRLVRVKAGDGGHREGALFFNFGGPGINPLYVLPRMAYLWTLPDAGDPPDGGRRAIADRYDLVAVLPRGLRGGFEFACRRVPRGGDGGWDDLVRHGKAKASACRNGWEGYLGTLQHVHDMELARRALGEPALHFFGVSYGAWAGTAYARAYPEHAGRMVLDSSPDFTGSVERQILELPRERHNLFVQHALRPALAEPEYGLGADADAILRRLRAMPAEAREAWQAATPTPATLAAVLTLSDWIAQGEAPTRQHLVERVSGRTFSHAPAIDAAIRAAIAGMIPHVAREGARDATPADTYWPLVCGDTPWRRTVDELRALAATVATKYAGAPGDTIATALVCAAWPADARLQLPPGPLAVPNLLMVQAEFDGTSPLFLAMDAFTATPGAHVVVAKGMSGHGVFGFSATPCVEQAVAHYLLRGETPARRVTSCAFVPRVPATGPRRHWPDEVRDDLMRHLRRS